MENDEVFDESCVADKLTKRVYYVTWASFYETKRKQAWLGRKGEAL